VGGFENVDTAFSVITAATVGVAVPPPVTGRRIRPDGLGTIFASICFARATAVLFILAIDISWVFRACRSMAVGGAELMPASTNIIHPIPKQRTNMTKACSGTANFFIK
jgi:hypothetical protein